MFLQMYLLLINTGRDYRMVRGTVTIHTRRQRKPNEVVLFEKVAEFQLCWPTGDLDPCNDNLTTIVVETAVETSGENKPPRPEKLSMATRQLREEAAADEEKWNRCATYRIHLDLGSHQKAFERRNQQLQWARIVQSTEKQQRSQDHQKKTEPRQKQHCYP